LHLGLNELNDSLPTLKKDLSDKMRKVRSDLEGLPKSFVDNPQAHLLSLCNSFAQAIGSYTNGKPNYPPSRPTFLQGNVVHYRALEKEIKRTRPHFKIPPRIKPPQYCIFEDDSDKKESLDRTSPTDTTRILTKIAITLVDVRQVIEQMSTRELYGIIPFQVHEHFIQCFVSEWESICLEYFGKVERILKDVVETMCETYFGRFQTSGLLFDIRYYAY
jgi:hypothetical protein